MGTCNASDGVFPARLTIVLSVALWAIAVGTGLFAMARYETTPGSASAALGTWPVDTRLTRSTDRPTVVMFAHPRCPCTRASIAQLAQVLTHSGGSAKTYVAFYTPVNAELSWCETDVWRSASEIAGVSIVRDAGAVEATRFGVHTSGGVLVFDEAGNLIFQGGVTGARGRTGDNPGSSAVAALLLGKPSAVRRTPVFGCDLFVLAACPQCGERAP